MEKKKYPEYHFKVTPFQIVSIRVATLLVICLAAGPLVLLYQKQGGNMYELFSRREIMLLSLWNVLIYDSLFFRKSLIQIRTWIIVVLLASLSVGVASIAAYGWGLSSTPVFTFSALVTTLAFQTPLMKRLFPWARRV